eukprot:679511-Rhodomonas_salina.1
MAQVPHQQLKEEDYGPAVKHEVQNHAKAAPPEAIVLPLLGGCLDDDLLWHAVLLVPLRKQASLVVVARIVARVPSAGVLDAPVVETRHVAGNVAAAIEASPLGRAHRECVERAQLINVPVRALTLVQADLTVLQTLRNHHPDHAHYRDP